MKYSIETTRILNDWFNTNITLPYPSIEERKKLSESTKLTIKQVTYWMSNKRKQLNRSQ